MHGSPLTARKHRKLAKQAPIEQLAGEGGILDAQGSHKNHVVSR